jgi:hypothetical protein
MTKTFRPRLHVLPPAQRRLWDELGHLPEHLVLYGGTALALHLGHRQSEDFDFFADRDINPDQTFRTIPFLSGAQITQAEPNTLVCLVERGGPVKVSFFGVPHLDIAGTKAAVLQQRAQAKDYVDIDALVSIGGIDLATQLAAARAVYGPHFAPTPTLKALTYFGDGDLSMLGADIRRRLVQAATAVDPSQLPTLERNE